MTLSCTDIFKWDSCWSVGTSRCCDREMTCGPLFMASCNVPCESASRCYFNDFAPSCIKSSHRDCTNRCETTCTLNSQAVVLLAVGALFAFAGFVFFMRQWRLRGKPWMAGDRKSCPFTLSCSTPCQCKICGAQVANDAFVPTLTRSWSTESRAGSMVITEFHSSTDFNYNHCVGCHALRHGCCWVLCVIIGSLTFLGIGGYLALVSSAEDRDNIPEGPFYGIGIPLAVVGGMGIIFSYNAFCRGLAAPFAAGAAPVKPKCGQGAFSIGAQSSQSDAKASA